MQNLIKHEQFEMEVLEKLHNSKVLNKLIFVGGTMLRLCYGLDRYSRDLDFWLAKDLNTDELFKKLKNTLEREYDLKDFENKHYSLLFEIYSSKYPSSLKIEIRKDKKNLRFEKRIAYSPNYNTSVILNVPTLKDMMKAKIDAFLDRGEIRDIYDIEFIFKKEIKPEVDKKTATLILDKINKLTRNDYKVKLGSLINSEKRKYYNESNFLILKDYLTSLLE